MKLKEFGHGGRVPRTPSLDPPMNYYNYYVSKELIYMSQESIPACPGGGTRDSATR